MLGARKLVAFVKSGIKSLGPMLENAKSGLVLVRHCLDIKLGPSLALYGEAKLFLLAHEARRTLHGCEME